MKKIDEFLLCEIANSIRHIFIRSLSDKASVNKWESKFNYVKTNKNQDALFVSMYLTKGDEAAAMEDIKNTIEYLKVHFTFDLKQEGFALEFTNIKDKEK